MFRMVNVDCYSTVESVDLGTVSHAQKIDSFYQDVRFLTTISCISVLNILGKPPAFTLHVDIHLRQSLRLRRTNGREYGIPPHMIVGGLTFVFALFPFVFRVSQPSSSCDPMCHHRHRHIVLKSRHSDYLILD